MEVALRARRHTDLALGVYLETIEAKMADPADPKKMVHRYSNEMRQRAADALLDRGWGRPSQDFMMRGVGTDGAIPVTHNFPDLKDLPVDELAKLYRACVAPK